VFVAETKTINKAKAATTNIIAHHYHCHSERAQLKNKQVNDSLAKGRLKDAL